MHTSTNLRLYLDSLPRGGVSEFAARVGVSPVYLSQLAAEQGGRVPSPALCVVIERESHRKVIDLTRAEAEKLRASGALEAEAADTSAADKAARKAAEKADAERRAAEKAAADKAEGERKAAEKAAAEQAETVRKAAEKAEADRIEADRVEAERKAREQSGQGAQGNPQA